MYNVIYNVHVHTAHIAEKSEPCLVCCKNFTYMYIVCNHFVWPNDNLQALSRFSMSKGSKVVCILNAHSREGSSTNAAIMVSLTYLHVTPP